MFSIEGDTGVAFGKGLGVGPGSEGGAKLRLGANVLEGHNGGVGGRCSREDMTVSFTVSFPKRDTQKISLCEMAMWCCRGEGAPSGALCVGRVRPRPTNHWQQILQLLD